MILILDSLRRRKFYDGRKRSRDAKNLSSRIMLLFSHPPYLHTTTTPLDVTLFSRAGFKNHTYNTKEEANKL